MLADELIKNAIVAPEKRKELLEYLKAREQFFIYLPQLERTRGRLSAAQAALAGAVGLVAQLRGDSAALMGLLVSGSPLLSLWPEQRKNLELLAGDLHRVLGELDIDAGLRRLRDAGAIHSEITGRLHQLRDDLAQNSTDKSAQHRSTQT